MTISFKQDRYPGKPRVLFIGIGNSTHTQSWIDLLEKSEINVRLFSMPGSQPPNDWTVPTYVSNIQGKENQYRKYLIGRFMVTMKTKIITIAAKFGIRLYDPTKWLVKIIREWQPQIIHTLGVFDSQGGEFFLEIREKYELKKTWKWVLHLRGGSDIALRQNLPEYRTIIQKTLEKCDYIICDNYKNIDYVEGFGIKNSKFAPFVPVPGTGGIDIEDLKNSSIIPPSKRERMILWPKAYDSKWSVALPVIEAIRNCWEKISPCEIHMLAITPDTFEWFMTLPENIRVHCHIHKRLPRLEVLDFMKKARIMLAPSLVDGVPNSLYEAMAFGAFPIVSPLNTIVPVVKNESNVLFARNLYPDEIGEAIVRAMNDDTLIDNAFIENYYLATKLFNRKLISQKVVEFYNTISQISN